MLDETIILGLNHSNGGNHENYFEKPRINLPVLHR